MRESKIDKLIEDITHISKELDQLRTMTNVERDSRYIRLSRQLRLRQTELAQLQGQEVLNGTEK